MRSVIAIISIILSTALCSCAGEGSDGNDASVTYMGGAWRGKMVLSKNECGLDLVDSYDFSHLVAQDDSFVDLEDERGKHFVGQLVSPDAFSVDSQSIQNYEVPDGRICDISFRWRYESINNDNDRLAHVRLFYIGNCTDDTTCESEFAGEGERY